MPFYVKKKLKLRMLIEYDEEFHFKKYYKEQKNEYCKFNNIENIINNI